MLSIANKRENFAMLPSLRQTAFQLISLCMLSIFAFSAQAMTPPDQLTQQTADRLLAEVKTRQAEFKEDTSKLYAAVDEIVLPHFDFAYMSRLVLARNWKDASNEQQARFQAAFRGLLVRTYANALLEYSDEKLEWKPLRMNKGDTRVKVQSEVIRASGPSLPIDYSLRQTDDGWKVYDVSIESISLVTNYRGSFAAQIKRDGIEKLIQDIEAKAKSSNP